MITAIIISIALNLLLSFSTFNLLRKLEKYEDIIDDNETFIQNELQRNEALLEALRQIDNRQMFEKDDDVGSIFNQIKETINRFKNK
jgi:DNA-binding ferritin-like protein